MPKSRYKPRSRFLSEDCLWSSISHPEGGNEMETSLYWSRTASVYTEVPGVYQLAEILCDKYARRMPLDKSSPDVADTFMKPTGGAVRLLCLKHLPGSPSDQTKEYCTGPQGTLKQTLRHESSRVASHLGEFLAKTLSGALACESKAPSDKSFSATVNIYHCSGSPDTDSPNKPVISFALVAERVKMREPDVVGPEGEVHVSAPTDSPAQATQGVNDLPMSLAPVSQQQVFGPYTGSHHALDDGFVQRTRQYNGAGFLQQEPSPSSLAFAWPDDPLLPLFGNQSDCLQDEFEDPDLSLSNCIPQATQNQDQQWINRVQSARSDHDQRQACSHQPSRLGAQTIGYDSRQSGYEQAPWDDARHPRYGSQQHGYDSVRRRYDQYRR